MAMVRNGEPSAKKRKSVKVCPSEVSDMTKEREIFTTMEYMASAPDSDGPVKAWIANQTEGRVGDFIDNKMVIGNLEIEAVNSSNGEVLSKVYFADTVDSVVASSKSAAQLWGKSGNGFQQSKMLYSITREIQKQSKLLALTESISSGVHIRETKEAVTSLVQALYHYTGVTQSGTPLGVVSVLLPPVDTLSALAKHAVPALAAGNTIILQPSRPLPALLFAQLCAGAGLPRGVVNVMCSTDTSPPVDGVVSVGPLPEGVTSPIVKLSLPRKSSMVVFAVSDVDSAAQTCLDKAFSGYGKTSASIGRVLVQQPVYDRFCKILRERLPRHMVGSPLDGCVDVGCSVQESITADVLERMVGENGHLEKVVSERKGYTIPCTVVFGVHPSSSLWSNEPLGPLLCVAPFKTAKEATALLNHSARNSGVSVWSESNSLIMQLVKSLNSEIIWVNTHGGSGSLNGAEALRVFTKVPSGVKTLPGITEPSTDISKPVVGESVNETIKMLIGGALKRSCGETYRDVYSSSGVKIASVPNANKKDLRDCVEAAAKSQPGWAGKSAFNRSQILYFLAENLSSRKEEFISLIQKCDPGCSNAAEQVDQAIEVLFDCAGRCDKLGSHATPLGVVGCVPSAFELPDLMRMIVGPIVAGNVVIVVPGLRSAPIAAHFAQVISVSDVPGGVINIMYGSQETLGLAMAQHPVISGLWYPNSLKESTSVQREALRTPNKTAWLDECSDINTVIRRCLFTKTVVMPAGNSFAN